VSDTSYLAPGLAAPEPRADNVDRPFWEGLTRHELWLQRCNDCRAWQWGPEAVCHSCLSFNVGYEQVDARGRIYSWERVWHAVHPALANSTPYVVALVEIPQAGNVRLVGNLIGDATADIVIGSEVVGVFEDHEAGDRTPRYTLLQWERA